MKNLLLIAAVVCLTSPLAAQPNTIGFEYSDYLRDDGFRIFFDSAVDWSWGGILQSPYIEFFQTQSTVDAWLVLIQPTADALEGFRIGRRMEGSHVVRYEVPVGSPLSFQVIADIVTVVYDSALPMNGEPMILLHWVILNPTFEPVAFFLWPAPGDDAPVYLDGAGIPVEGNTHNGSYYEYTAPVAVLNGGVSPNDTMTFGGVKQLFR